MKNRKLLVNKKGQFTLIAAVLVTIILVAAVMATYASIRYNQNQSDPQIQSSIDQVNMALNKVLGFAIGYYGSIIKVTGNETYAQLLATNYINSGLITIESLQSDLGISFTTQTKQLATNWFSNASYSAGNLTVGYSFNKLSVSGLTYSTSCQLNANISQSSGNKACITVLKDNNEPIVDLGLTNFQFYNYSYSNSTWIYTQPTGTLASYANGTYLIDLPSGIDPNAYIVSVEDTRGITVSASSFNRYTCTVNWNSAYVKTNDYITVEFLQNGTMNWLGQHLVNQSTIMPIPPLAVKAIHVNMTINGKNQEVPFQVEDWASDYQVPLGLTNNATVFSNRQMIVFILNRNVTQFTIWWDGRGQANQTAKAYTNLYFNDKSSGNPPTITSISNRNITLEISGLTVTQHLGSVSGSIYSTANFMRINSKNADSTGVTYAIYNGTVRDVVRQEAEFSGGGASDGTHNCYNVYANVVIKLSANVTYYTYDARLMFVNSSSQNRTIADLCPIRLTSNYYSSAQTENGTLSGFPNVQTGTYSGYNYTVGGWTPHHWSQLYSSSNGAGLMFTDAANKALYIFNPIAVGGNTSTLSASTSTGRIELLPVTSGDVSFPDPWDITWSGAVVVFSSSNTPIYKTSDSTGLWALVEYPPAITVTAQS